LGLDKDEHVAKNGAPSYLPEFIRIEVAPRKRQRHASCRGSIHV
jgi:hypothetical protein